MGPAEALKVYESMVEGLNSMHQVNVFHQDIKTENILIGEDDDVLIADFGKSTDALDDRDVVSDASGNRSFKYNTGVDGLASPEVLEAMDVSDVFLQVEHAAAADFCPAHLAGPASPGGGPAIADSQHADAHGRGRQSGSRGGGQAGLGGRRALAHCGLPEYCAGRAAASGRS